MDKALMLGNEAVARGLYEAGVTVVSSYPGTPSTEITEYVTKYNEIYSEWAPNEKVAFEVAFGAATGGARSFCAMKHVGLNVASDPVFSHAAVGIQAVRGNGETLISAGKDKMLVPASNMKLISTGAALFSLGPDYRFSTTLAHDGHISDGVLHGNLYIVGGGDPLLGSKDSSAVALSSVFEAAVASADISHPTMRVV